MASKTLVSKARYIIDPPEVISVPIIGEQPFPVRRIYCVGKNYADHVAEMGGTPGETPPVFFTKPRDGIICPSEEAPFVDYPPSTENLHFEAELVLALKAGGSNLSADAARNAFLGIALGCDLTRRDLQFACKEKGNPWDIAKAFDQSAVMGPITVMDGLPPSDLSFSLAVNGVIKQKGVVRDMIYDPVTILQHLSRLFRLAPGDLIYTGTPEGVGPLTIGDRVEMVGNGLAPLAFTMR